MDWSIQHIAKLAGTTSRTLRHYGDVGILEPTRIGGNGYRYYDELSLVRLQRILMLRDLGLSIPAIAEVLAGERDNAQALTGHLHWLKQEQDRLDRQIAAVENTLKHIERGEQLMADQMFDGFDSTRYKDEVEERWGKQAYADSSAWWGSKSAGEQAEWMQQHKQLATDWQAAAAAGLDPEGAAGQALASRHADWLTGIPGTPSSADGRPTREYFVGLGEMYVADDRFAANYGGTAGAQFVRDAMAFYARALAG